MLCRSSVNEANELNFFCFATFLIRFCPTGDPHNFPFLWAFLAYRSCFPRWDAGSTEISGAVCVPAACIPGRRVESGGRRENCSQRDLTCHRRVQQAASAPPAQQPHTGFLLAEPQLDKLLNTAPTRVSVLCRRDLKRADAFSFCRGLGLFGLLECSCRFVSSHLAVKADIVETSLHCPTPQDSSA